MEINRSRGRPLQCYCKTKTNMLVATDKTRWLPADCEAAFSARSLGKSMQCYLPTSSRAAKIFQARGGTWRQRNEGQGNGKHSSDTYSPDHAVLANLRAFCVARAAQLFGCGSAALCLCVEFHPPVFFA